MDKGTYQALTEVTQFVKAIEKRTGVKIACLEENGYRLGWISKEEVVNQINGLKGNYYKYLLKVVI